MLIIFSPFPRKLQMLKSPHIEVKCKERELKKRGQKEKIHKTERWNKMKWHRYLLAKEDYLSYWRLSLDGYKQLPSGFLQGRGQHIRHIMHGVFLWHRILSTGDLADTTKQTSPKATGKHEAQRGFLSHQKHCRFSSL